MIVKSKGVYVVKSEKGRVFGRYKTHAEALKRLRQMEHFKGKKGGE